MRSSALLLHIHHARLYLADHCWVEAVRDLRLIKPSTWIEFTSIAVACPANSIYSHDAVDYGLTEVASTRMLESYEIPEEETLP